MIVLVGFMGAGKTTVGRLLADRLGLPFVDTDLVIEDRERRTVPDIFAADGEQAFRDVEQAVVADVVAGPEAVVSLGGGACGRAATREVLRAHTVVHLDVSFEQAKARTAGDTYRPMLHRPGLAELHASRRVVFEDIADLSVRTDGRRAETIALEVLDRVTDQDGVLVAPPGGTYRVHVRAGSLADVGPQLPATGKVLVVGRAADPSLARILPGLRAQAHVVELPEGPVKTLDVYGRLALHAAEIALHPDDLVLAVGDEAVVDVAGFLAATYNRGVRWAVVPRSLEGLVDSSLGGKVALDLPQARNLLGAVHQPVAVFSDPQGVSADTDPRFGAGLAEAVKTALVADPSDLELLVAGAPAVLAGDVEAISALVRRAVVTKARIVTADEREAAGRLHLNYGHTFSHAFEQFDVENPLSLGLMAAAHLARRLGLLDDAGVGAHRDALRAFGLVTAHRFRLSELQPFWLRDKKFKDGVRFVLLHGPGRPEAGVPATDDALTGALEDLAEDR
ncbi:bifunctional shikimate kinase/3-dehydroquinate synthase [Kineococcus rhizosphaerae]|uniref:Shikimate kinase n=1 Tax=Kineococcus rhizosphaerae TaxID=559628 RepID=A0A2T0R9T2_9ACTN|nr:bifunctional shikimate kinase/3-dehydroquinate synthase [Kineococcus rhizosphaerae]PRY17916.1 3-dehydroquinate synthase [Kineococcus rhizosphaerae]